MNFNFFYKLADTENKIIYGVTDSLSLFGVMYEQPIATVDIDPDTLNPQEPRQVDNLLPRAFRGMGRERHRPGEHQAERNFAARWAGRGCEGYSRAPADVELKVTERSRGRRSTCRSREATPSVRSSRAKGKSDGNADGHRARKVGISGSWS